MGMIKRPDYAGALSISERLKSRCGSLLHRDQPLAAMRGE